MTEKKKPNLPKNARWGGRFDGGMSPLMSHLNASIDVDQLMWQEEIDVSSAHVRMLTAQNILTKDQGDKLLKGLTKIAKEMAEGTFPYKEEEEDIHMNVEARLYDVVGEVAGRLHTARSRNDQVSACMRLYMRRKLDALLKILTAVIKVLQKRSREHAKTIMPGFTHGQIAQPIMMGWYLSAFVSMLRRDEERLLQTRARMNESPLGACALRGTSFPINPVMTSKELGFIKPIENNLDAVSDRDFVADTLYSLSMLGVHLSRFCEDIFVWFGEPYNMVKLPDSLTTGSSMMPNKRNPDSVEILRSHPARTSGALQQCLMTLKALPMGYCKDMQALKPLVFDEIGLMLKVLPLFQEIVEGLIVNKKRCRSLSEMNDFDATQEAEKNVQEHGMTLREAHRRLGQNANMNHPESQTNLGKMYDQGLGVPQDYATAREWYEKAAQQGFARAQTNLGWMYHQGLGVPQDYATAREWYEKAAQQGHAEAQNNLGAMYHQGQSVPQDYAIAREWFEKAAQQGFAETQFNLGVLYAQGHGVPQDYAIAREWYEKAAQQGNVTAQSHLKSLQERHPEVFS